MRIALSILIPTLPSRNDFFKRIRDHLSSQIIDYYADNNFENQIEILANDQTDISIGVKRNVILAEAQGEYMCFIDDDDRIADNYVALVMAGIATNPDCCSLNGIITTDGKDPRKFIHSIDYTEFFERDGVYYRCPNHLNVIKTELARQCPFPDWQRSEDSNFAFQLRDKGLLKKEYKINETLYYYDYVTDKRY